MRSWSRFVGSGVAGAVVVSSLVVPLSATPAMAAVPPPISLTQTAARDFGNGGPADEAAVQAAAVAVGADGRVVFYDRRAREVRAIDPTTHVVTVLAGTGAAPATYAQRCSLDGTQAATTVPLFPLSGLWITSDGDVYAWSGFSQDCFAYGDIYRLAASDGRWHLALKNPPICCVAPSGTYHAVAVDSAGNMLAYDGYGYLIRRIAAGDDPSSQGTIVAGVANQPGGALDGEGGPATSAHLADVHGLVASADGSFAFGTSVSVRRVDTSGLITTVAGTGTMPPYGQPSADVGLAATSARVAPNGLLVSPSDPEHYWVLNNPGGSLSWQSFEVGGVIATTVGPQSAQTFTGPTCLGSGYAPAVSDSQLLVTCGGGIRSWPSDGSAALAPGARVAGIDNADGVDVSPDGVTLSHAFLPVSKVVEAPDGSYALSSAGAIRTLSGLSATDTLGTLTTAVPGAYWLAYGADGTLYATTSGVYSAAQGTYAVTPAGVVTHVLGGGSSAPVEGAAGTSVAEVRATALDAAAGVLYFAISSPPQVWGLDLTSGTVHRVLGSGTSGTMREGMPAVDAPLSSAPNTLTVDPATQALYLTFGGVGLLRIDHDGTLHNAALPGGDLYLSLAALPNGVLVNGNETIGPDGAQAGVLGGLGSVAGVTSDNRVVGQPPGVTTAAPAREAGGLLSVSAPVPAPVFPEATPTVQVTPGPGTLTLSVTPAAGTTQALAVYGDEVPADGGFVAPSRIGSVPNDRSGTTWEQTYASFSMLGGQLHLSAGHTYRLVVVALVGDGTTSAAAAPISIDAEPLVDTTAPAAPGLTATPGSGYVSLQVTAPADADFHHMVVTYAEGSTAPTSPTDGTLAGTLYASGPLALFLDPARAYTFAAFAFDNSGNVSTAATAQRPAATLATGAAATNVAFAAGSGCTWIIPPDPVLPSYLPGTTAPATPAQGTVFHGAVSTAWGPAYCVPVANGAKVAVSLFSWTDAIQTQFRRTSFVLTGGLSGDTASLVSTSLVSYGGIPAVSARLVRAFATGGTQPLAGHALDLYRRPVGTTTWVKVATVTTRSTGAALFTVPVPTGHVDYQVRSAGIVSTLIASAIKRTSVQQTLTLAQSATSVRHGYAVSLYGVCGPKRATRVYLQRYVSGRWVTLTYLNSATTGAYKFSYKPPTAGTYILRTYISPTTTLLAGVSANRALKAT